jgi:hypothetical protein
LLFAWIAISMAFARAKPDEKPPSPAQDFSKEAYVRAVMLSPNCCHPERSELE